MLYFAVVALLPCGANGDSMCVTSEDGSSQHPKEASKIQHPPPQAEITEHTFTVQMDKSVCISRATSHVDSKISDSSSFLPQNSARTFYHKVTITRASCLLFHQLFTVLIQ